MSHISFKEYLWMLFLCSSKKKKSLYIFNFQKWEVCLKHISIAAFLRDGNKKNGFIAL